MKGMMVLQSSGLTLRSTTEADLDYVLHTEQDESNRRYISQWTREQHLAAIRNEDQCHFIVEVDHAPAGYVILAGITNPNQSIELTRIAISRKEQGLGKATLKLIIQWVFEEKQAHRLWLDVKEFNHRARHVYESVGFVAEGTLRECIKYGDSYDSLVIMSILRSEFGTTN